VASARRSEQHGIYFGLIDSMITEVISVIIYQYPPMITISCKRTKTVDLQSALFEYIRQSHHETHPEAFKWDAAEWQRLRREYEDVVNGATELRISSAETISRCPVHGTFAKKRADK
jgi:BRO1-like domain